MVITVTVIDQNSYFIFMWALLVPPVTYFILGRIFGSIVSSAFFIFFIVSCVVYPRLCRPIIST
jgi:hypothetical protein